MRVVSVSGSTEQPLNAPAVPATSSNFRVSLNTLLGSAAQDGTYRIYIAQTDRYSNGSPEGVIELRYDTTAPAFTLNTAEAVLNANAASPNYANTFSRALSVSGAAGLPTLDLLGVSTELEQQMGLQVEVGAGGSLSIKGNFSLLANGAYTLNVNAQDLAGNAAQTSFRINLDKVLPSLAPSFGADRFINAQEALTAIEVSGSATDVEDGQQVTLRVMNGQESKGQFTATVTSGAVFRTHPECTAFRCQCPRRWQL